MSLYVNLKPKKGAHYLHYGNAMFTLFHFYGA